MAARATHTLANGLASRFHQSLSPRAAARTPVWRVVAASCACLDVAKAAVLSRDDEFRFLPRLVIDLADLGLWCVAAGDDPDTSEDAMVPGVALAAEVGARLGVLGMIVPLSSAIVAGVVRRGRHHRLRLYQASWQVMGVLGGWALARATKARRDRDLASHRAELAARSVQAERAGFHDAVISCQGPLDVLQRASALVDLGGPRPRLRHNTGGAIKAAAAEGARGSATYLADTLSHWQSRHNTTPDLRDLVLLELDVDDGSVLLTSGQSEQLHRWLDAHQPRGRVRVVVTDAPRARRPFAERRLMIGPEAVVLDAERGARVWSPDALPAAFLMFLGWLAQPTGEHREGVPWRSTAGPMALAASTTVWSVLHSVSARPTPQRSAVASSFAITLSYTLAASRTMRHPHTDSGVSRFPWVMPLQGLELVRRLSEPGLSPLGRGLARLGVCLVVGSGWMASPPPRSGRALVSELGWVVAFSLYADAIRASVDRVGKDMAAAVSVGDQDAIDAAYELGRRRARAVVEEALTEATRLVSEARGWLAPDVHAEAERRLAEAERLLADAL